MDPEGRWLLEGMQQTSARVIRVQNVAHHRVTIPVLAPGELDQVGFGECFRIGHGRSPLLGEMFASAVGLVAMIMMRETAPAKLSAKGIDNR
jgi:hypothetical protein